MQLQRVKKVAVAMSGGVDSSVAALLLKQQGYEVSGFFMRNWSQLSEIDNDCPWQKDYEDVRKVCSHLGIAYATFNFEEEYKTRVLNHFINEYQAGRTPNPDVLCNREIKFDLFLKKALTLGFDYIATGHYAKLETNTKEGLKISRPTDKNKDQTYFLCHLQKEQLQKVLFPLSNLLKSEVRQTALKAGLPNAQKKDSQGICFIGKLPLREFLKTRLKLEIGSVVDAKGKILGKHQGTQLYTIGQRHIGVAANGLIKYVSAKDYKTNTLMVGDENDLYKNELTFTNANWLADLPDEFECDVQIRYRTNTIPAKVKKHGEISFASPARAITPGQFVAFYKNDRLLGGSVIK